MRSSFGAGSPGGLDRTSRAGNKVGRELDKRAGPVIMVGSSGPGDRFRHGRQANK
ncbi:MAG: hypothetical protein ACXWEV_10635 [Methylobacter sp.]